MNKRLLTTVLIGLLLVGCGRNYTGEYLLLSDHMTSFGVDTKTGEHVDNGSPGQLLLAMSGWYREDYIFTPARHHLKIQQKGKKVIGELYSNIGGKSTTLTVKSGFVGDDDQVHLELSADNLFTGGAILKLDGIPGKDPGILLFPKGSFSDIFGGMTSETHGKDILVFKKLTTPDLDKAESELRPDLIQTELSCLKTYSEDVNNPFTERLYRALVNSKVQIPEDLKARLDKRFRRNR